MVHSLVLYLTLYMMMVVLDERRTTITTLLAAVVRRESLYRYNLTTDPLRTIEQQTSQN
jgi:hypothetical protein